MEMTDTREMLEERFAALADTDEQESQTQNEPGVGSLTADPTAIGSQPPADEWLNAPKSFKAEYAEQFKTLPPEWRKYLIEREGETEKGFSHINNELNQRKWIDEILTDERKAAFKEKNVSPADYFKGLVNLADILDSDPHNGIKYIAQRLGIDLSGKEVSNEQVPAFMSELETIKKEMAGFKQYMEQAHKERALADLKAFTGAKDEQGNLVNKYFENETIKSEMARLMRAGLASNLKEAYERALWQSPEIREQLIREKIEKEMMQKTADAQKAKTAAFSPKGKQAAFASDKPKTTRELLEEKFEALESSDN